MMKRRLFTLIFCALMMSLVFSGCNSDSASEAPNELSASSEETMGIPEEVKAKLQAVLDAPPIQLPAEEWREETVKDAIFISGEKLNEPLTLRDFGEGLEVRNDDTLVFLEDTAVAYLTYFGNEVATCMVKNCSSFDEIYDCPLQYISFYYADNSDLIESNYPIAINGVTMGSSTEKMVECLYFMKNGDVLDNAVGDYGYSFEGDTIDLIVTAVDYKVKDITLKFK